MLKYFSLLIEADRIGYNYIRYKKFTHKCAFMEISVHTQRGRDNRRLHLRLQNKAKLDELSKFLYERETITGEEFMQILNADS